MLDQAQAHGAWLANRPQATVVPDVNKVELNIGEPALEITPAEAAELFATVVRDGAPPGRRLPGGGASARP